MADAWRHKLSHLKTWKQKGKRAVHKPLLTLMLIARAERGDGSELGFAEVEAQLASLLKEFGPPRKSYHPEFPFWHLASDGFWSVQRADEIPLKTSGSSPTRKSLLDHEAIGTVREDYWRELCRNADLRSELAGLLLDTFWPPSLHAALRSAVGLPELRTTGPRRPRRDPKFREDVMRAYRGACAVCGFDGQLSGASLGVQAAHVKWHAYGGPDSVTNGLALCAFHHLALDMGAMGLDDRRRVAVSMDVRGSERIDEQLYQFEGKKLREPQPGVAPIEPRFIAWHWREVFKSPARGFGPAGSTIPIAAEPGPFT